MIYVYTSILNGWDNLRPPAVPIEDGVKFICFTNLPNLQRVYPWEYRPAYLARPNEPWLNARIPKILPHVMLPEDAQFSIYHDGNFVLKVSPKAIVERLLQSHDWASHQHPCRDCIYQEAEVLLSEKIGTSERVQAEIDRYRAAGHPARAGLWANGLLVRRHCAATIQLNEAWWKLYSTGCERDQLSFPVVRRQLGVEVNTIREDIYGSPFMLFRWHAAWRDREDNPDFWPERDRNRARLAQLTELTGPAPGVTYSPH